MPSRGAPWRGAGRGKKNRIGEPDILDDSITSADIKDGTIQEVDLDTALTDKINAGGGGNGVGGASLALAVLEEEFIATQEEAITNRFNIDGVMTTAAFSRYGNVKLDSASTIIGDIAQLDCESSFRLFTPDADFTYEAVVRMNAFINSDELGFFGAIGDRFVNGISNEAQLLAQSTELAGFIADKSVSDNWRIVSQDNGVSTVVQTSVPVSTGYNAIKMIYTKTPGGGGGGSIDYFAGEAEGDPETRLMSLGTINTNIPVAQVAFCFLTGNRKAQTQSMNIEFLKVSALRDWG